MKNCKLALSLLALACTAQAAGPAFTTLQPGAFRNIAQNLDVNLVFLGYEPGAGPRNITHSGKAA